VYLNLGTHLHYYNIYQAVEDEKAIDRKLMAMRRELESGHRMPEHEAF
jgi:hypothetical protein